MKRYQFFILALGILFYACQPATESAEQQSATIEEAPEQSEWITLFDGSGFEGWHTYLKDSLTGWSIEEGALMTSGNGGDLVTDDKFKDFELVVEWKISPNGNSGIMYHVVEDTMYKAPYHTGPEYQVLDDPSYEGKITELQKSAANYDMQPAPEAELKPVGEWNEARIIAKGNHIEHWLNGKKVVDYERYSDEWKAALEKSKWKDVPGYAKFEEGHIALQDHGNPVWYRNIKIKRL